MKKNLGYSAAAYFIYRSSFVGISSVALVTLSKQNAWISILIAFILGIIPLYIFYMIAKYKPDYNIIHKIDDLFKHTSLIIKLLLAISVFSITLLSFWNLTNLVVSQFLSKTPVYVISLTMIIPIIYLTCQDSKVIARVSLILFFIALILFGASAIGLTGSFNLENIGPISEYNPLNGALAYISYNVLPIFILLIFPNKNIKHSLIIGYVSSFISLFIVMFFLIGVLGINLLTIYQYPEFHILKFAFEKSLTVRLENVLSTQWILDIFIFTSIGLKYCNDSFKLKNKYIIPILLIVLNTFLFSNNTIANILVTYVIPYFIPIPFFIIPIIMFIKIKIRSHRLLKKQILQ